MAQLCQECYDPLPDQAAVCARCGTARPKAPAAWRLGAERARRSARQVLRHRRVAALTVLGLLLVAALPALRAVTARDPAPLAVATDSTAVAAPLEALPPGAALPDGVSCMVGDEGLPGPECVSWVLRAPAGEVFRRLATDGEVIVAASGGSLTAIDAGDGRVRWRREHRRVGELGDAPSELLITDDRVVALYEAEHRVTAFDLVSGHEVWSMPLAERRYAYLEAGPAVVVVREPTTLTVRALDDGMARFQTRLLAGGTRALVAGNQVVAVSGSGATAWDLGSGAPRWTADVPVAGAVPMIAAADTVVALTTRGGLAGVDLATGSLKWLVADIGVPEQLTRLDDDRIAVVSSTGARLLRPATGLSAGSLAIGGLEALPSPVPGELFVTVGDSVQRLSADLAGETWSGWVARQALAAELALARDGAQTVLAAVLGDGRLLGGFHLPSGTGEPPAETLGCPELVPSEALGPNTAWRGARTHIAVHHVAADPDGEWQHLLLVGLPDAEAGQVFTISARHMNGAGPALIRDSDGDWSQRAVIRDGRRMSGGWPPHWGVMARFPASGCWRVHVETNARSDEITVPVPPPPA